MKTRSALPDATNHDDPDNNPTPLGEPPSEAPLPVREPIDGAPRDGRTVHGLFGAADAEGRMVHWHLGRVFNGRRWKNGGKWRPSDLMPMREQPTEWLRYGESPADPLDADMAGEDGPTPTLLAGADLIRSLHAGRVA